MSDPHNKRDLVKLLLNKQRQTFLLTEKPDCGNLHQLELTGVVYESFPKQFEVTCRCGCTFKGIALLYSEIEK